MSDMDEDYGFEYSDEEQDEEQVDVENQYYNAKGLFRSFLSVFLLLSFSLFKSRSNELFLSFPKILLITALVFRTAGEPGGL
jgi:hypothetical protein